MPKEIKQAKASKKPLSLRRRKLVDELANPMVKSVAQAARNAGYAPSTVRSTIYGAVKDPVFCDAVQGRIDRALKNAGVTPEEVIGSAAYQMRSSIDDVLNERGEFDIDKARATGVIDLVKKVKIKTIVNRDTGNREITHEIEMLSNQDGRKEVANYKKVENFAPPAAPDTIALTLQALVETAENRGMQAIVLLRDFRERNVIAEDVAVEVEKRLIASENK